MRKILPIGALILAVASFSFFAPLGFAGVSCEGMNSLIELNLGPIDPPPGTTAVILGEWKLPISSDRPEIMTDAKLRVELRREAEQSEWYLIAYFHYDTAPDVVGLPFTFQKISADWVGLKGHSGSDKLDWSDQCREPGKSFMPGQRFTEQLRLNGASNRIGLKSVKISLWGSQN